ncbi:MAG: L,D-transpeptidase family protein [Actinomycetota bacterium]
MLKVLPTYIELERQERENPQPPLPPVNKPVARGRTYPGTALLAQRLRRLGDLAADAQIPAEPDLYSGALVEAVQHFQRRHGLPDDGRITPDTVRELNVPMSVRLMQLKLTLERWRWLPSSLHSPLVVVNIPEFQLRAYSGPPPEREPAFTTKVIVGKAYRHRTPVFVDEMEYVIFRPYWNVPSSIIRNEILPALRRNPAYLSNHRMEMVSSSGRFEVRQRPGPGNALGLVKFVFPNEYDVYLHGTPEKALFNRVRRDFSHGCIRVEDPEGLAVWVFRNDPSWTREQILAAMNGDRTMQVNLPQHIPVLIFYATAMVDESGEVRFFDDIYKLDAALERALASAPH